MVCAAIVTRIMGGHSDARSVDLERCFLSPFLLAVRSMPCCVGWCTTVYSRVRAEVCVALVYFVGHRRLERSKLGCGDAWIEGYHT